MFFILHKIDCKIKKMYKNTLIKKIPSLFLLKKITKVKKVCFVQKKKI